MASIVISESVRSICSRSWGIAVISLDFSSVATWPRAIPSSLAQALTMCSGPRSCDASCEPRHVLPSMAISRSGSAVVGPDRVGDPVLEALLKGLGLESDQQPANAIARGDAVGERRNCPNQSRRFAAQR